MKTNHELTIEEISMHKIEAEGKIMAALEEFTASTGLGLESMEIEGRHEADCDCEDPWKGVKIKLLVENPFKL